MITLFGRFLLATLAFSVLTAANAGKPLPPGPFPLQATAISTSKINLSWSFDSAYNKWITGFRIDRERNGETSWTSVDTTHALTYSDAGLEPGSVYHYRVCAVTPYGDTAFCETTATTLQSAPINLAVTNLSQTRAIQIAKAFCQKIGNAMTVAGAADMSIPLWHQNLHWQRRWHVVFPGQAEVEVVDSTGVVCHYENLSLNARDQQSPRDKEPAGDPIPEAEAIRIATTAMQATGQTQSLKFSRVVLGQGSDPPLAVDHHYAVIWQRTFHNVPYRDQQLAVDMNAETGEIRGMSLTFPSPPPTDTSEQTSKVGSNALVQAPEAISQAEAEQIAKTALASLTPQGASLVSTAEEVVQPNNFWQSGGKSYDEAPGPAHVAWTYRFDLGRTLPLGQTGYEVWVDAVTGDIIGGTAIGSFGGRLKPQSLPKSPIKSPPVTKTSK